MKVVRSWTHEEMVTLETLFHAGLSDQKIGEKLNRNKNSVNKKLHMMGHWRNPWGDYQPPALKEYLNEY